MWRLWRFLVHALSALVMAWGWQRLNQLNAQLRASVKKEKGGQFLYPTIQVLASTLLFMIISMICDLPWYWFNYNYHWSIHLVLAARKVLLMTSLMLSFVVSTIYWMLVSFFPALILNPEPPNLPQTTLPTPEPTSQPTSEQAPLISPAPATMPKLLRPPIVIDLTVHLFPLCMLLVNFYLFERRFTPGAMRITASIVVAVYLLVYICFMEYCARVNGAYPYPFLTKSRGMVCMGIYVAVGGLMLGSLRVLNALHP